MRLVKLSTQEFEDLNKVNEYFQNVLPQRTPPGKFMIPKGWIAEDRLSEGELVLFSFNSRVVRVAQAASGRRANDDPEFADYPYYFLVDLDTLREVEFSVEDLERSMQNECGVTKSIAVAHGWVLLPDTPAATQVVERLSNQSAP